MRDYEELVATLRECKDPRMTEAADVIEELSKPKWISVEERLPENDSHDRFLVYAIEPWFGTKVIDFMRYDGRWLYDGKPTEAKVTHWMNLPEAPKEE